MQPDSLGNGDLRRIGHFTQAISMRIESASVDETEALDCRIDECGKGWKGTLGVFGAIAEMNLEAREFSPADGSRAERVSADGVDPVRVIGSCFRTTRPEESVSVTRFRGGPRSSAAA